MNRQVRTKPRKLPSQERSRVTVDTILAATARVLVKKGFDGLTTNAVAEAAGVSIGSLYQYFPSKEALVAALIEQHIEEMNSEILNELTRVAQLPMAQAVRGVIELTIKAHAVNPELHKILTEQVPRVGRLARLIEADNISRRMVAGILAARKDELAIVDVDTAAFLLCTSIEAIVHRAALLAPERLRDQRLIDESVAMVTRYLGIADG
jgi:AcrR family transcriptional regulator